MFTTLVMGGRTTAVKLHIGHVSNTQTPPHLVDALLHYSRSNVTIALNSTRHAWTPLYLRQTTHGALVPLH